VPLVAARAAWREPIGGPLCNNGISVSMLRIPGRGRCERDNPTSHEYLLQNISVIDNYATGDAVQFHGFLRMGKSFHGKNRDSDGDQGRSKVI
jgi:hypothetical protein